MARDRKASAQRVNGGFTVRAPKPKDMGGHYELFVHDTGKIDGLPGTDDDIVLLFVADAEIRAEGWPSVADRMMRENSGILYGHGDPHY